MGDCWSVFGFLAWYGCPKVCLVLGWLEVIQSVGNGYTRTGLRSAEVVGGYVYSTIMPYDVL